MTTVLNAFTRKRKRKSNAFFLQKIMLKFQWKGLISETNFFKLRLVETNICMQNGETTVYRFSGNKKRVITKN